MLESFLNKNATKDEVIAATGRLLGGFEAHAQLAEEVLGYYKKWIRDNFQTIFLYGGG